MNKIQLIAATLLLIWSTSALHIGENSHLAYDNAADYLQGLQSQQSNFEAQIAALQNNLNQTVTAATAQSDIAQKISILEQGIINQENQIFITSTQLIPVLVLKDQCTNLTEADKTKLIQQCQATIVDIQTLQTKLQSMPQDARITQMLASASHQIYYLQTIQQVIQNNCTTATILSPTVYQSNVFAPNWITGSQTMNDIVNQYIARSQQFDNITNCPIATPFYNGISCVDCTGATPVFDMTTLKCTTCPTGQAVDTTEKTCKQLPPNSTNLAAISTTTGTAPTPNSTDIPCPISTPYFNGTTCISCPELFNFTTLACASCPTGTAFNSTIGACTGLKPNATNLASGNNFVGSPTNSTSDIPCPSDTPYFDGVNCISCPTTSPIFNLTSGQCGNCPTGSTYNSTAHVCQTPAINITITTNTTTPTTPNATNLASGNNYVGPTPNTTTNDVACPSPTPYFNGVTCVNCVQPTPIFNITSKTCTACPTGTVLDNTTHTCIIPLTTPTTPNVTNVTTPTTPNATNLASGSNYVGPTPNVTTNDILCPVSTPYFNGTNCTACVSPTPLFNTTSKQCTSCPAGTTYDSTSHTCNVTVLVPNATNTNATNFVGSAPVNNTNNVPCPITAPFFNGTGCVNCTDPTPIFNTSSLTCTACQNGTVYNSTTHNCTTVTVPPVTPNATSPNATNPNATNFVGSAPANNTSDVPCPITAPFFNGTGCVNCTDPTPIFNTSSLACTACPSGTVYNSTTHNCTTVTVPPGAPNATNPNATNFVGSAPVNNTNNVPCPITAPFFNGTGCVNCTDPTPIFNTSSLTCISCPNGTIYNSTLHSCIPITPNATNPLAQNGTIGIVPNTTAPCPVDTPFYNGTACISCPPLTPYFNLTSKTCVPCTNYDAVNHTCSPLTPNATNIAGTNSTIGNLTTAGPNDIPCPEATPFFVNGNCIACVEPNPYFYPPINDCVGCPVGSTYDPVNHGCVAGLPYTSNLSATNNWVSASPFRDSTQNKQLIANNTAQPCPAATPFFNGQQCISCPTLFNLTTLQCVTCPTGQVFDQTVQKCIYQPTPNLTNPNSAPNLIYGDTPQQQWVQLYNQDKLSTPTPQDCVAPTPYYNGNRCIACTPDYPYFDLSLKDCVNCPSGYQYTNNQCISQSGSSLSPTFSSMAATALGHQKQLEDIVNLV